MMKYSLHNSNGMLQKLIDFSQEFVYRKIDYSKKKIIHDLWKLL